MTKALDSNPILVNHTRGGIVESFHRGTICIVNESGEVLWQFGDIQQVCYPRSALKLFQHIPLLVSGAFDKYGFSDADLAIMCGSHNGEDQHVAAATNILQTIGLSAQNLGCGAQSPTLKNDFVKLIKQNLEPGAIHNNCSGKHAGFLAYCQYHGLPTENYLSPDHPLHQEIRKITALFHEVEEASLVCGVDGCSAPIFAMPVYNQALAYKNLSAPEKFGEEKLIEACRRILKAIAKYPFMLAGTKRYCSDLISATNGKIIGKTGADGVYSMVVPERKIGICIKVDDGRMGPQYNIAQAVLEALDLIEPNQSEILKPYLLNENKNFAGNFTGNTQISEELEQFLLSIKI